MATECFTGGRVLGGTSHKRLPTFLSGPTPFRLLNSLKRNGGDPQFTVYPDAGHDSWTVTYENPQLHDWLLKHKRD